MTSRLQNCFKRFAILLALGFAGSASLAADEEAQPPSRVARLNHVSGKVSFSPAGSDDWVEARLNRPLTVGDRLWVEEGGRAELHVGATALRLTASTAMEILDLGDKDLALKITQGSFSIRVRELDDDEAIEISTPNLAFTVRSEGEYRFDVDPDRNTTALTVRSGSGVAYGNDASRQRLLLSAGQRMRFDGADLFPLENGGSSPRDEFDRWAAARDAREDAAESARYVSRSMTGYEDLDAHGDWRQEPGYGAVWVPRARIVNWAPYQHGRWEWIAPWGWTWVDDAPWGFAPFHYGRWAHFGSHWGWVPGPRVRRAVYAPALVAFVGGSQGSVRWGVSLSAGLPGVAWFALGPNEVYRPAYTRNPRYVERVNVHIVVRGGERNHYVNQRVPHAVAVMSADDFARGRVHRPDPRYSGHGHFERLPAGQLHPLDPLRGFAIERSASMPPERTFQQRVIRQRESSPFEPQGPGFDLRRERDNRIEPRPQRDEPFAGRRDVQGERWPEPAPVFEQRRRRDDVPGFPGFNARPDRDQDRGHDRGQERGQDRAQDGDRRDRREPRMAPVTPPFMPPIQESKPDRSSDFRRMPTAPIEDRVPRMRQPEMRVPEAARPVQQERREPQQRFEGIRSMRSQESEKPGGREWGGLPGPRHERRQ